MSKSSWESSRNDRIKIAPFAAITAAVIILMIATVARPLAANFIRRPLAAQQSRASAASSSDTAHAGISGQIVDSVTGAAISGGEVTVALEQPDGTGTDVVFTQTTPDSSGHFSFNLLPMASPFDLVAVAINGSGGAYDATVVVGVSAGTQLGAIPLTAESGDSTGSAKIEGTVTASSGSRPSSIRVTISAIQTIDVRGGLSIPVDVPVTVTISGANQRPVTIPGGRGTSADVFVRSSSDCPATAANVNCGHYVIVVPGSNPSVGTFNGGKISYSPPAAGPALYSVRAYSFSPFGQGASVCIPWFQSVNVAAEGQSLKVSPGGTVTAQPLAFTGCW